MVVSGTVSLQGHIDIDHAQTIVEPPTP
jgi:hypothetical protein